MQKLQLYIGTERVDLFKDETVSFTQTIQNVKDISKIFTEFSKTFSLPASKVNNKIFKYMLLNRRAPLSLNTDTLSTGMDSLLSHLIKKKNLHSNFPFFSTALRQHHSSEKKQIQLRPSENG